MDQGIPACDQQFQGVVEAGRVRLPVGDQRPKLVQVFAQQIGTHGVAAGGHPIDIASHRVDFPVMSYHAERMGKIPSREGIGREPLMHQRQCGDQGVILEVKEILAHLVGKQHPLVN